ncbi:MAG: hypothetical protein A2289_07235 [Deltaproteobacteria bacterium RIFOXYA12_FULL_58_15]|nr:MAG: hypothetical protein A2289_07235 [Deltaproteobacteria bacterium RIFOXYA12_FULL_58_15]
MDKRPRRPTIIAANPNASQLAVYQSKKFMQAVQVLKTALQGNKRRCEIAGETNRLRHERTIRVLYAKLPLPRGPTGVLFRTGYLTPRSPFALHLTRINNHFAALHEACCYSAFFTLAWFSNDLEYCIWYV